MIKRISIDLVDEKSEIVAFRTFELVDGAISTNLNEEVQHMIASTNDKLNETETTKSL